MNSANKNSITFLFIQPAKSKYCAYIDEFNRTEGHGWLDVRKFKGISRAQ